MDDHAEIDTASRMFNWMQDEKEERRGEDNCDIMVRMYMYMLYHMLHIYIYMLPESLKTQRSMSENSSSSSQAGGPSSHHTSYLKGPPLKI